MTHKGWFVVKNQTSKQSLLNEPIKPFRIIVNIRDDFHFLNIMLMHIKWS